MFRQALTRSTASLVVREQSDRRKEVGLPDAAMQVMFRQALTMSNARLVVRDQSDRRKEGGLPDAARQVMFRQALAKSSTSLVVREQSLHVYGWHRLRAVSTFGIALL